MSQKRLDDVGMAALKALVTIYGPREAARKSEIPVGTVLAYAFKYKWKKASGFRKGGDQKTLDAGDAIAKAFAEAKEQSTINLAEYTRKASGKAAIHKDPLEVARKVRDVAGVYQVLWPQEEEGGLIEGAILIGTEKPTINAAEIEAAKVEVIDVRAELQDQRPAGD